LSSSAPSDPLLMSGLAALTGRAGQAVELATHARAAAELEVPVSLRGLAEPLLVLSAMGAAPDTLALLRRRTGARIERFVDGPDREIAAMRWLARPATLAFSSASLETASSLIGLDPLLDAQVSWLEGDTAAARASLEDFGRARSDLRPGTITLDALYPEAELWVFLGYPERATEWIDPTLDALAESAPHILGSPVRAASLVRALALRARLAQELGDTEGARTWAQAFVALWIDADDNLQSLVTEMAEIASGQFPPP
ncbi:MAG: hypothetical protein OEN00_13995, partial [Gemmatimonadota bacterium]|nr:hypothetical protein [Gemmatimonadota bacterium]